MIRLEYEGNTFIARLIGFIASVIWMAFIAILIR
jgi:hypothetical protein